MSRASTAQGGRIRALPQGGPARQAKKRAEASEAAPSSVEALDSMDRDALLSLWVSVVGDEPPPRVSQPFLRRMLAFELQAREQGGLPAAVKRKLESFVAAQASGKERTHTSPKLKSGGRLLREWGGVTHVVDVVEGGFLWRGERHRSLSAIARAITGAHWSGPRFFGLQECANKAKAAGAAKRGAQQDAKEAAINAGPAAGPRGRRAGGPPGRTSAPLASVVASDRRGAA